MKKIVLILMFFCFLTPSFAAQRTFSTLDNENIDYQELISKENTVLFIWATWCPSCRRELGRLSEKRIFFKDISVWYINTGENKSSVKAYTNAKDLNSTIKNKIILDQEGYIAQKFSVTGIPTYIFFKNGEPAFKSYYLDNELLEKVFEEK